MMLGFKGFKVRVPQLWLWKACGGGRFCKLFCNSNVISSNNNEINVVHNLTAASGPRDDFKLFTIMREQS